jgi:hypothetical protein
MIFGMEREGANAYPDFEENGQPDQCFVRPWVAGIKTNYGQR